MSDEVVQISTRATMARMSIALGESVYELAQGQDYAELKDRIEAALRTGGGFVEFVVVGNRTVSAFLTGAHLVVLSIETVPFDSRDTGDVHDPFGGFFDL